MEHRISYEADADTEFRVGGVHVAPHEPPGARWRPGVIYQTRRHAPRLDPRRRDLPLPGLDEPVAGRLPDWPGWSGLLEFTVAWRQRGGNDEETSRRLGPLLLGEMARIAAHRRMVRPSHPAPLRRLVEHVRSRTAEPVTVADLARAGRRSQATVYRLFAKHLGCTPVNFINREKMLAARRLLLETDARIAEVGRAVGVQDPYYFSRLFRKHAGETASRFRQRGAGLMP